MVVPHAAVGSSPVTPVPLSCPELDGSGRARVGAGSDRALAEGRPELSAWRADRYALLPLLWFRDLPPPGRMSQRDRVQEADRREQRAAARRTILSAAVAWHRVQLLTEVREAALFGGPYRPWPATFLPTWCAPQVGPEHLQALLDLATTLDRNLRAGQVTAPCCTLEEILRLAVSGTFTATCRAHGLPEAAPLVDRLLGCRQVLARWLWQDGAEHDCRDPSVLYASGRERLLSEWWLTSAGAPAPATAPQVTFTRLRPLGPDEPRPGGRCEISMWARPAGDATRPADPQVRLARRTARRRGDGWVPAGVGSDLRDLTRLCEHQLQRPVLLRAALQPDRLRELQALLLGFEVDERGDVRLLLGWQDSLLALPVKQVASLRETSTGPAMSGPERAAYHPHPALLDDGPHGLARPAAASPPPRGPR